MAKDCSGPILSVVIPTHGRPKLLERAIQSALPDHSDPCNVEVIVVPNGADTSWQLTAARFSDDPRVHWYALATANASAARNMGLQQARGHFARFLDDDDVLYPAHARQVKALAASGADVASATLEYLDSTGTPTQAQPRQLESEDLMSAALVAVNYPLAQASVFRLSAIRDCPWPEDAMLFDDYLWMLHLATRREHAWIRSPEPVACYFHHDGSRLSRIRRSRGNARQVIEAIVRSCTTLENSGRMTPERKHAAATALLSFSHSAFPAAPIYLSRAIILARQMTPTAKPNHSLFETFPALVKVLLLFEWSVLPLRMVSRSLRRLRWMIARSLSGVPFGS